MNRRVNTIDGDRKINPTSQTQIDKARRDPKNGTPYYYSRMACRPTSFPMKALYTVYTIYTVTVAMFEAQHDWMQGLHTMVKQIHNPREERRPQNHRKKAPLPI